MGKGGGVCLERSNVTKIDYIKLPLLSVPFDFFYSVTMRMSAAYEKVPACPSLMCFFTRGNTEGTNSSKILCLMFEYFFVLCEFVSGLILWLLDNLWFDDLRAA